jgi:DNA-directed RNA polymerase II subunit RPB3
MIQLRLDVRCDTPGVTFEVTSSHLEVHRMQDFEGGGSEEELSKRPEYLGWPVSKSAVFLSFIVAQLMDFQAPGYIGPPITIAKLRKGQELRLKCFAKKAGRTTQGCKIHSNQGIGHRQRSRKMVTMYSCWVRI